MKTYLCHNPTCRTLKRLALKPVVCPTCRFITYCSALCCEKGASSHTCIPWENQTFWDVYSPCPLDKLIGSHCHWDQRDAPPGEKAVVDAIYEALPRLPTKTYKLSCSCYTFIEKHDPRNLSLHYLPVDQANLPHAICVSVTCKKKTCHRLAKRRFIMVVYTFSNARGQAFILSQFRDKEDDPMELYNISACIPPPGYKLTYEAVPFMNTCKCPRNHHFFVLGAQDGESKLAYENGDWELIE